MPGHAVLAMRAAKVGVRSRLRKGVLVHCAAIGKSTCLTIHVIRRTKLVIRNAWRATRDTVAAACPGPTHRVAYHYVDGGRRKREALTHCNIHRRARS